MIVDASHCCIMLAQHEDIFTDHITMMVWHDNYAKCLKQKHLHNCPSFGCNATLKKVRLLHDTKELFFIHLSIAITICLIDHLLKLLIGHPLPKLLCGTLQVLEGDFPSFIVVEQAECFQDLVLWIPVENLMGHHLEKFLVLDCATAVIVVVVVGVASVPM